MSTLNDDARLIKAIDITSEKLQEEYSKVHNSLEYSMLKLIAKTDKTNRILSMYNGDVEYDHTLPISIELQPINLCNLNCEWCVDLDIRADNKIMPIETMKSLLFSLKGNDVGLTIEGGGSLLYTLT